MTLQCSTYMANFVYVRTAARRNATDQAPTACCHPPLCRDALIAQCNAHTRYHCFLCWCCVFASFLTTSIVHMSCFPFGIFWTIGRISCTHVHCAGKWTDGGQTDRLCLMLWLDGDGSMTASRGPCICTVEWASGWMEIAGCVLCYVVRIDFLDIGRLEVVLRREM